MVANKPLLRPASSLRRDAPAVKVRVRRLKRSASIVAISSMRPRGVVRTIGTAFASVNMDDAQRCPLRRTRDEWTTEAGLPQSGEPLQTCHARECRADRFRSSILTGAKSSRGQAWRVPSHPSNAGQTPAPRRSAPVQHLSAFDAVAKGFSRFRSRRHFMRPVAAGIGLSSHTGRRRLG
jgi:hypothetical protein